LFVSSAVTMSVPFALGKIVDLIYEIDKNKEEMRKKSSFEENLRKFCLILTGVFAVGGLCNFGRLFYLFN
jgi:hypothetical protein